MIVGPEIFSILVWGSLVVMGVVFLWIVWQLLRGNSGGERGPS